ncbi:alpha/beta hydrolase [Mucilaginibacter terrae]|uniref:alpha/beta hydrolase n=1 Tax=Mucilaginibacter terrae TaxID=1955052 RepID=UPI00363E5800
MLSWAAKVDTISTYSIVMHKSIKSVVIIPDSYSGRNRYPVVYLLHGYGGNYSNWMKNVKELKTWVDQYQLLIVCPDGGWSSWYLDSPVDSTSRYESYVASELVGFVDKNFHTIPKRTARAITGLSMGGHGALYLAIKHQDVFGAAGSMSGGVDIRPFPGNWELAKRLGTFAKQQENWDKNTVINMLNLLSPNSLALMMDCGTEDFFYKVNLALHEKLQYLNIPHDYVARPGTHNWSYWSNAIGYQLLFMHNYFSQNQPLRPEGH